MKHTIYFFIGALFLALIHFEASAQEGSYYVQNYEIESGQIDNPFYSVSQGNSGLIYITNRSGILEFDGRRWQRYTCPGAVYSLAIYDTTKYVAGKFGFGYLNSRKQFISLQESAELRAFRVIEKEGVIYFFTEKGVFLYNAEQATFIKRISYENGNLLNSLSFQGRPLVISESGEIQEVVASGFTLFNEFSFEGNERPVFIKSIGESCIVGTNKNNLYSLFGGHLEPFIIDDEGYLQNNDITSAEVLNDTLLAVGTLRGGVAFYDIPRKKLLQIINTHTGLSDNEVLGLQKDLDNGLWVTENNGLDRIGPYVPLANYSHYPGLNGKTLSVHQYKNDLYVGTTMGVYQLEEVKNYTDVVKMIRLNPSESNTPPSTKSEVQDERDSTERKGLFSFLKKDKKEGSTSSKGFFTRIFGVDEGTQDSVTVRRKVYKELQSIRYVFERVKGIDSQNTLFTEFNGKLINGGTAGLYEIKADTSLLISREPIRTLLGSKNDYLIAATLDGEIIFFRFSRGRWREIDRIESLGDQISYMYEDRYRSVWMTGNQFIFRLLEKDGFYDLKEFSIVNPYSDKTLVFETDKQIYFVNPTGHFRYDAMADSIQFDSELKEQVGDVVKYLGNSTSSSWFSNGESWWGLDPGTSTLVEKKILSMVQDILFIDLDKNENVFWVITSNNEILQLQNLNNVLSSRYELMLKEVRQPGQTIPIGTSLRIDEENGSVTFEYVHPDYSGILGIRYRYKLTGLQNEWSEWSTENRIRFPYLPPGDYSIITQSRDIFGQVNESVPVEFSIIAPYWEQPWFYALQVLIFTGLLVLSIWLSKKSHTKYLIINRLLAFLTLILFVEYVQAIGEANFETGNSPVLDFVVQVCIASAMLPLEHYMRKWLIKVPENSTDATVAQVKIEPEKEG